jgi:hypothetical protein
MQVCADAPPFPTNQALVFHLKIFRIMTGQAGIFPVVERAVYEQLQRLT